MSTRSMLCIKQADGSLKSMFKHWDGYPSYMVPILEHFNTDELAEELVSYEAIESLMTQEQLDHHRESFPDAEEWSDKNVIKLSNGDYISHAVGEPRIFKNLRDLWRVEWAVEYVYVWNGYKWIIVDPDAEDIR